MDKAPADPQNAPADPQNAPADPQNAPGEPQNVLAIPQNVPDIPQNDQPSQGRVKKTLTLKLGATMQVVDVRGDGKNDLTVQMLWNVPSRNIENKSVVMKYSDLAQNVTQTRVFAQLGGPVFVDVSSGQVRAFTQYIEQQIEEAENSRAANHGPDGKTCLEVNEVDVYKVGEKYYFIAGAKDVFILNEEDKYSSKLSENDIEDLDFCVVWLGQPVKTPFESNDEKAMLALVNIIAEYSSLVKKEEYHGCSVACIVMHLRAYLYEHILLEHCDFYTTMVLSGIQRGTGKSLFFSTMQSLLYGRLIPADTHISDAMMYRKLAGKTEQGKVPVYVNEWDNSKASKLFNNAVKGIWESSAYSSVVASNKPRTVLMVNANATPNDIKFDPGVRSKVSVVATPPDRLSHVHKLAKTKNLVKGAKGDHPYLPSVLGFAIKNLMEKVDDDDVRNYCNEVDDEDDERAAQIFKDFDSVFYDLDENITKFNLPRPPMFHKQPDHTCLTRYNQRNQEQQRLEAEEAEEEEKKNSATVLIQHLVDFNKLSSLVHKKTKAMEGYIIGSLESFPEELHQDLRQATESFITTLEGRRKARLRYIPIARLTEEVKNTVEEHMNSFVHLYFRTAAKQRDKVKRFAKNFIEALDTSCNLYDREVSDAVFGDDDDDDDLFRAVSNRDSEVTDEVLEEGSDDEPASSSLTCGVPRCPNANTQWPSKERLEKHRATKTHNSAVAKRGGQAATRFYPVAKKGKEDQKE